MLLKENLPPCEPHRTKYKTIHTCHRKLMYLQKRTGKTMDMWECGDHWHIRVDPNWKSPQQIFQEQMRAYKNANRTTGKA